MSSFNATGKYTQSTRLTMQEAETAAPPTLEDMKGDEQARCVDWFKAYAQDLPTPLDAEMSRIGMSIFAAHKRARLGGLFKIAQGDVESTIGSVASDPRGWRMAMEEAAGFTFAQGNVPPSFHLMKTVAPSVSVPMSKSEARIKSGTSTISDDLLAIGQIPEDPINEACFSAFTTDFANSVVLEREVGNFIDNVLCQFKAAHFKNSLGAPLLQKCAAQAHRRIKFLPARGKVLGKDRRFFSMLYDKSVNRGHVRFACISLPCHTPRPCHLLTSRTPDLAEGIQIEPHRAPLRHDQHSSRAARPGDRPSCVGRR